MFYYVFYYFFKDKPSETQQHYSPPLQKSGLTLAQASRNQVQLEKLIASYNILCLLTTPLKPT